MNPWLRTCTHGALFLAGGGQSEPDGHGYELVSSVRALVPQKFSVEEELMHVKHVEAKSPHVGVMWKFGRGVINSGGRYPLRGLKYRQCVLEECESYIQYRPIPYIRCRTSVEVHNAAVQHPLSTVSPDSNPTIVVLQTDA
ncbi:hypothetical protein TNCV_401211 [Trichonephila clavipes]|nr:hypothetical protein TNCV_401211 [Trichonephila clavipes]